MRRDSLVLASVEFADALAVGVLLPLLPAMARRFGLGVGGAAALIVVPVIAAVLAGAWLGPLSGRWGRKAVLVGTCLVTAEALFVLGWAGDVFMLFMSRIATGVAAGNVAVVAAVRKDLARDGRGAAGAKPAAVGLGLGVLVGVILGSLLGGAGQSAPAYAAGALAVISLLGVVALMHETLPLTASGRVATGDGVGLGGETVRAGRRGGPPSRRR